MTDTVIHEKLGRLQGDVEGLRQLIQTGVVDRLVEHIDADHGKFADLEERLRTVEQSHVSQASHHAATRSTSAKWAGGIAAAVTLAINVAAAIFNGLIVRGH